MSEYRSAPAPGIATGSADMSMDTGLRAFMLGVYNKVTLGLVLSGVLAHAFSVPPLRDLLFVVDDGRLAGVTMLYYVVAFAPVVLLLVSGFAIKNPSPASAGALYWGIVALIGASLGAVVLRYTGSSIALTFFATAASFAGLSLFGYTTKRNLTGLGSFLIIGVIGLIVASVVNMFLASPPLPFAISAIGVLIFAGLIAYDTQRLKTIYYELAGDQVAASIATNYSALSLYINFINLFQFLLSFLGNRR